MPVATRTTRSSVLGKRTHQPEAEDKATSTTNDDKDNSAVSSPDSSPMAKRPRTGTTVMYDPNGNKENIPPLDDDAVSIVSTASSRSLRRTVSEFSTASRRSSTAVRRQGSESSVATTSSDTSVAAAFMAVQAPPTTAKVSQPIHVRTRALLRATCNSAGDFAGRVTESNTLRDFITSFFTAKAKAADDAHPILYISGSPGCGKTALINNVLNSLEDDMQTNGVKLSFVNCMAMNNLDAVWERLVADFGAPKKRGKQVASSDAVQKLFATRKDKCLLILDEVDHVATSSQALAKLFSIAQNCSNTLRIIGIANTHTLTSSSSQLSLAGVKGVQTLHFAPYEPGQLVEILNTRLQPLHADVENAERLKKFLPAPTLKLLSMKIASQTGDVRAIFEVLRNAIDISVAQAGAAKDVSPPVTPTHIQAALKAYAPASRVGPAAVNPSAPAKTAANSEMVSKVRALGLHARLGLLGLLIACKRAEAGLVVAGTAAPRTLKRTASSANAANSGKATIDAHQLHTLYSTMLAGTKGAFTPVSRSEFSDIVNLLETVGFVTRGMPGSINTPTARRKLARTQSFGAQAVDQLSFAEGIRAVEVLRGLGIAIEGEAASAADRLEEEAGAIWDRELTRIRKESAAAGKKTASAAAGLNAFTEAEEDA
ncbi:P-loop containing nucleoside triphosphate hydrolase protein [Peniophora sp. CONT]|nr:P-loop containing nucleoside triphosphate hydrolase protein [Peniophora sp. CONT]